MKTKENYKKSVSRGSKIETNLNFEEPDELHF